MLIENWPPHPLILKKAFKAGFPSNQYNLTYLILKIGVWGSSELDNALLGKAPKENLNVWVLKLTCIFYIHPIPSQLQDFVG